MKLFSYVSAAMMAAMALGACSGQSAEKVADSAGVGGGSGEVIDNAVIQTIMSRRSVRDYLPNPVSRDTMDVILKCGINAPNGMNRQPWELRVVDSPEFLDGITKKFMEKNPDKAKDPKFKNMFRNAPTVVFIAAENNSQLDCGLLGENMVLAAWSMGIGSCCLGGPIGFMKSEDGAEYLKQLGFSDGYELIYAIGFGYPAESPEAKPRDENKIKYIGN